MRWTRFLIGLFVSILATGTLARAAPSSDNEMTAVRVGSQPVWSVETNNTKIKIEESRPASDNSAKGNDGSCGLSSGGSIPLGSIGLFLGVGLMGFRGMFASLF